MRLKKRLVCVVSMLTVLIELLEHHDRSWCACSWTQQPEPLVALQQMMILAMTMMTALLLP